MARLFMLLLAVLALATPALAQEPKSCGPPAGIDERWGRPLGNVEYKPEVKHDLRSISKSATSLLVGIARGEGKFPDLDSPVIDQFPICRSAHAGKCTHHISARAHHVVRPEVGRNDSLQRSQQQRAAVDRCH